MDTAAARILADLTTRFYRDHAASFSATRQAPWEGWCRCLETALSAMTWEDGRDGAQPPSDAARCGNGGDATSTGRSNERGAGIAGRRGRRDDSENAISTGRIGDPRAADGRPSNQRRTAFAPPELRVLDLACGNLRFERFLREALPDTTLDVVAVDNCAPLVGEAPAGVRVIEADLVGGLLARESAGNAATPPAGVAPATSVDAGAAPSPNPALSPSQATDAAPSAGATPSLGTAAGATSPHAPFDLAVCFGFLHHVPGFDRRAQLLRELGARVRPGGIVAVSLWQFMDDPRLARKALDLREDALSHLRALGADPACLEPGDHLIGWQDDASAWRYCHHFDEAEVDALSRALAGDPAPPRTVAPRAVPAGGSTFPHTSAPCAAPTRPVPASATPAPSPASPPGVTLREIARFSADGRSGRLNRYLLLQRA